MSCLPIPLGSGVFLIRVSIYQGGSVSPDTSNYRAPAGKRARSTAGNVTRLSGNISYVCRTLPLGFGMFLILVRIYQGGCVLPDTSNYRIAEAKRARSTAGTGNRLYGNISYVAPTRAIRFRDFLIRVSISRGGSASPDTSNYGTPKEKGADRPRKLGIDFLEISVAYGRCAPLFSGICLIRVIICQGGSAARYTPIYRILKGKRARSTAETGNRLSGNISYVASPHAICFSGFS